MRKLKFRGKTTANGHWVYGSLIIHSSGYPSIRGGKSEPWVDLSTVGQFTGLTDRNGNEIYEGDIVEDEIGVVYEICWYHDLASFMAEMMSNARPFMISDIGTKYMTVLGNVFDNPELKPNEI